MPVIGDDARPGPDPGNRARPADPRGRGAQELDLPPANTGARQDGDRLSPAPRQDGGASRQAARPPAGAGRTPVS